MPFAVEPKTNCPHALSLVIGEYHNAQVTSKSCPCCNEKKENWVCLTCCNVGCGREVHEGAVFHFRASSHPIAVSLYDLSFWCYECDSYIINPIFQPVYDFLQKEKYGEDPLLAEKEKESEKINEKEKVDQKEKEEEKGQKPESDSDSEDDEPTITEKLLEKFSSLFTSQTSREQPACPLKDLTIEGVADFIKDGKCKNIIVMTGAGISVAAGIPDFRTPGTGLYDNLQKYNLPTPTAVFDISFFRENPKPFFLLAKELYPGNFKPTKTHYFIRLLHEKGLLLRNFTQNIDTLERVAGIPGDALVEAHGSFSDAHCIDCHKEHSFEFIKELVFADKIAHCTGCGGLVKPDIVFFGESLPSRFFDKMQEDFPVCDLLIVIGTSLQVQPFASLISNVTPSTPRLLINREVVGTSSRFSMMTGLGDGFKFGENNYRDVKYIGDCQDGVEKLAELLGWTEALNKLANDTFTGKL